MVMTAVAAFLPVFIRLIDNIYNQKMHIYICTERPLSYQSAPETLSKLRFANDRFRSLVALLTERRCDNSAAKISSI
jgi:hypothetical protein